MASKSSVVKVRPFKRVLVANRGEIAVRIIRALRELGIESVALYSQADRHSLHVKLADYAVRITGSDSLSNTYLHHQKVLQAALVSESDGIHPGYGFLSENEAFASLVVQSGSIRFIGPSPQAMRDLGDKVRAKKIFKSLGIPVLEGSDQPLRSLAHLEEVSHEIGFPLVLKAASGGGGRGMRVIRSEQELATAYVEARREAEICFGNQNVFCEKYLEKPRHIEFQTLFDRYGGGVHLFERDCSLQRRYQKILEEAPSFNLSDSQRYLMGEMAVKAGLATEYCGVATVEYICDHDSFYFMEMNTRIQVEHPVTEMITGVDLVKESIRVAEDRPLSFKQKDLKISGHAIEVRINAEDPIQNFAPSFGKVSSVHLPQGPFTRVETHISWGYEIPDLYDSLLAKVVVWGQNRTEAIERMLRALKEIEIHPLKTTISFHEMLLRHPSFTEGSVYTTFLRDHREELEARLLARSSQQNTDEQTMVSVLLTQDSPLGEGTKTALSLRKPRLRILRTLDSYGLSVIVWRV